MNGRANGGGLARPRPVREAPPPPREAQERRSGRPRQQAVAEAAKRGNRAGLYVQPLPWELDDDEQPTRVARSPLSSAPPPRESAPPPRERRDTPRQQENAPRYARPAPLPVARPIPNFRPAPAPPPRVLPASPRNSGTATGPSRRKRAAAALHGLPLFAWVLLSILAGAVSYHVAPPIVTKIGVLAVASPDAPPPPR